MSPSLTCNSTWTVVSTTCPTPPPANGQLLELLAPHSTVQIICEATGGYERDVVAALHQAAVPVSVLNPARVRHFARATGQRAKTDQIDAALLTAYGQSLHPQPTPARTAQEQQLAELIRRRVQVREILVAQRQQVQRLTLT
ncbi:MAG TPA: transposase, partial [Verrucomicrobiae bacterium]|nr:transposase [Verrucomicrobiae bacterium]